MISYGKAANKRRFATGLKFIETFGFAPDDNEIIKDAVRGKLIQSFRKIKKDNGEVFKVLEMRVGKDLIYKIDWDTKKVVTFYKKQVEGRRLKVEGKTNTNTNKNREVNHG